MTKKDMRLMLDDLIRDTYKIVERLEELRLEMHNRPPKMRGKATSRTVNDEIRRLIREIHKAKPDLPQHEIAKRLRITPARVSEVIAGVRT